jgi:hypothetical protein
MEERIGSVPILFELDNVKVVNLENVLILLFGKGCTINDLKLKERGINELAKSGEWYFVQLIS